MAANTLSGPQSPNTRALSQRLYSHKQDEHGEGLAQSGEEDASDGHFTDSTSYLPNSTVLERPSSRSNFGPNRNQTIKDGYIPGNQFRRRHHHRSKGKPALPSNVNTTLHHQPLSAHARDVGFWESATTLLWDGYSVQTINGFLLFLPLLYFGRVTAIFEEVHCSGKTLRNAVKENCKNHQREFNQTRESRTSTHFSRDTPTHLYWDTPESLKEVEHLKRVWNSFINSLTKEWETMNVVSSLLVATIIASMQIGPIYADEIVRYIGFAALVCGLMSLVFSCTYMVRFSIMRPIHKAVEWAKEGEKAKTQPFWNVWIFLSIPAIWLSWSLLLFLAEIFAFLWLGDSPDSVKTLRPKAKLAAKVSISVVLGIGIIYLILILSILKRYGTQMDDAWRQSIDEELDSEPNEPKSSEATQQPSSWAGSPMTPRIRISQEVPSRGLPSAETPSVIHSPGYLDIPTNHLLRQSPEPISPCGDGGPSEFSQPIEAARLFPHGGGFERSAKLESEVVKRLGNQKAWSDFVEDITGTWRGAPAHLKWKDLFDVLRRWNRDKLQPEAMEAFIAWEIGPPPSRVQQYVVYVTDLSFSSHLARQFPTIPEKVETFEIIDDAGVVRLKRSWKEEHSNVEEKRRPRAHADRNTSKTLSSDGGTVNISVFPPSPPHSRVNTIDSFRGFESAAEACNASSHNPVRCGFQGLPVSEVIKKVEMKPIVTRPEILQQPRSAMRTSGSGSLESKRVRHVDETPGPVMTPILEASKTAEELATRRSSSMGPGVSPLLQRHLSHLFFQDHTSVIQETYSADELSSLATVTPTPTLVISHKQIPYKIYVKKEPSITINNLLSELGNQLHKPVPDDYLRDLEPGVVSRLRRAAEQRARADGKSEQDPITEAICTVDLIWGEKTSINGFVERPDGTWELETQEN